MASTVKKISLIVDEVFITCDPKIITIIPDGSQEQMTMEEDRSEN